MSEKEIGAIDHFYGHISVGIIKLSDSLKAGEQIHIKGHATDFNQAVTSMQIEHANVSEAVAGTVIGIKVDQKVHPGDKVYKVS